MIGRLNHVAIAVPDLEAASAMYRDTLGAAVGAPQDEPEDYATPVWAGVVPVETRLGRPEGDERVLPGVEPSPALLALVGRRL